MATLAGHTSHVTACAVTPDGRHVVSASSDKTLKVWDLTTHTCRITHCGDAGYLITRSIAVGPMPLPTAALPATVFDEVTKG